MEKLSHYWLTSPGAALGVASAVLFGASTPFAKLLLGDVDPWLLAGLLYLGSGLGLGIVHLGRRFLGIEPPEAPLRRSDLPWLAAVILAGGVVGPLLLMLGLSVTPASSAALLLNVRPCHHGHRLGGVPRAHGPPDRAWRDAHSGWRRLAILARGR